MANAVYPKWKEQIIQAGSNSSLTGTTNVLLVDTGTYTYSAAHVTYNELSGIVGTILGVAMAGHSYTNGTFDAADATFTAVTGASVEALVIYIVAGSPDINRLVLYLDTSQTGLPVTPNGGDITVTWSGSGIFTISDRRLKDDIEMVDEMGELPVYRYRYNDTERVRLGFMAQDVERVVPNAVIELAGRKLVNYDRVIERFAA